VRVSIALLQTIVLLSVSMAAIGKLGSEERSTPVAIGEAAPDFTLEDQNHNKVTLSDARGKNPVVLVFYRGYW
jgi:cytochrome oxidase Cu insertion factor (SCO1/SenC/PrrC family)